MARSPTSVSGPETIRRRASATMCARGSTRLCPRRLSHPENGRLIILPLRASGRCMCARFPNGTIAFAPHLTRLEEDWPGGFVRKAEEDAKVMEGRVLPTDELHLKDLVMSGHTFTYDGVGSLSVRPGAQGGLQAFAGTALRGADPGRRRVPLFGHAPRADLLRAGAGKTPRRGGSRLPSPGSRRGRRAPARRRSARPDQGLPPGPRPAQRALRRPSHSKTACSVSKSRRPTPDNGSTLSPHSSPRE